MGIINKRWWLVLQRKWVKGVPEWSKKVTKSPEERGQAREMNVGRALQQRDAGAVALKEGFAWCV